MDRIPPEQFSGIFNTTLEIAGEGVCWSGIGCWCNNALKMGISTTGFA
jgi:hypothetical protein